MFASRLSIILTNNITHNINRGRNSNNNVMATSPKRKSRSSQEMPSRKFPLKSIFFLSISFSLAFSIYIIKAHDDYLCRYFDFGSFKSVDDRDCHMASSGLRKEGNETHLATNNRNVNAISIIGERNSGTTWMYDHLADCFINSIPVKRRLSRYKHWFQTEEIGHIANDTLVIAMFRNPFEWIEGMRKKPHHAPKHMFLGWKEFVSRPWTMERVGSDLTLNETIKSLPYGCQESFSYHSIISCDVRPYPKDFFNKTHYSEHQPFYEMKNDGSGEPYSNILDMRAAKIHNFLSTQFYDAVRELWILQYEEVVRKGTEEIILKIEEITGTKASCTANPPQNRKHRNIDRGLMEYLVNNADWEAEELVGYSRKGIRESRDNSTIYKIWSGK